MPGTEAQSTRSRSTKVQHRAYLPAVGYARVSTDEQAREGVSLEVQQSRIRAYCEAKELELVDVLVDDGISGKTLDRPALHELLQRCERGQVGHVVVVKLDRLTRRTRDLLALVDDLFLARHIELHSVSESLDTSTPHGRFVLTLFGGLAQMERELIGERTKSALAYKRQQQVGIVTAVSPLPPDVARGDVVRSFLHIQSRRRRPDGRRGRGEASPYLPVDYGQAETGLVCVAPGL